MWITESPWNKQNWFGLSRVEGAIHGGGGGGGGTIHGILRYIRKLTIVLFIKCVIKLFLCAHFVRGKLDKSSCEGLDRTQ